MASVADEISKLHSQWANCTKCTLHACGRKQVVFKDGPVTAKIMLVGEGPGAIEDQEGIPFSGPAGKLMTKILASVGIARDDVYWTNATRCMPKSTPTIEELTACKPLLVEEIRFIRPKVILIVGRPAAQSLVGLKGAITPVAGQWTEVSGIPALIIFHPAAILHTQELNPDQCQKYKESIWHSMKSLRAFLDDETKQPEVIIKNDLSFEQQLEIL